MRDTEKRRGSVSQPRREAGAAVPGGLPGVLARPPQPPRSRQLPPALTSCTEILGHAGVGWGWGENLFAKGGGDDTLHLNLNLNLLLVP